jgi:prefoldin subunit 5
MQRINALKECRGADDDTEQIISKNLDQLYAQLEIINENITALHLSINRSEAGVEDINKRKQELTDQLDVLGDMLAADPEKN